MKIPSKTFFDLFINKKFSFSILLICLLLSFAACGSDGSDGSDSGKAEVITITMKWSPNGTFTMGSSNALDYGANPPHSVTLTKGFYMGIYEVTQEQYEAVMGTNPSWFTTANGQPPELGESDEKRPVEWVRWYDAIEFCNALSVKNGLTPYYSIDKTTSDPNNTNGSDPFKWLVTRNDSANGYRLPTEALSGNMRAGQARVIHTALIGMVRHQQVHRDGIITIAIPEAEG